MDKIMNRYELLDHESLVLCIEDILKNMVQFQEVFIVYDVATKVPTKGDKFVTYDEIENTVNRFFAKRLITGYNRSICNFQLSGDHREFVYYPAGKSPKNHPLISKISVIEDNKDNNNKKYIKDRKMKMIEIKNASTHRYFATEVDDGDTSRTRLIKCAYDLTKDCSPECAACALYGSLLKAVCNRSGDELIIGMLET